MSNHTKESAHTPGPWGVCDVNDEGRYYIVRAEGGAWMATVATSRKDALPADEVAANARLIAAAPELLELVRDARALLIALEHPGKTWSAETMETLRAACVKFQGEAAAVLDRIRGEL